MNYAAILADHEISRDEIVPELKKRGWQVVSKEIEPYDELPSVILVWILFDWKTLGYHALPCQGYVRIVPEEGKDDRKTYFYVARSPWYVIVYHKLMMWGLLKQKKLKWRFRKKQCNG
jgi:hypothetical protein